MELLSRQKQVAAERDFTCRAQGAGARARARGAGRRAHCVGRGAARGCLEAGCDWWSRAGWARRGAAWQPGSPSAPRACSPPAPRPPDPRPARAGAPSRLRAPGGYMESVRLVPVVDLCRCARLPRAPPRQLPGAPGGRQGRPTVSKLSLFKK